MPWSDSAARSLTLPPGAGPDDPRILIGPDIPPELVAWGIAQTPDVTFLAVQIWYYSGSVYFFSALGTFGTQTMQFAGTYDPLNGVYLVERNFIQNVLGYPNNEVRIGSFTLNDYLLLYQFQGVHLRLSGSALDSMVSVFQLEGEVELDFGTAGGYWYTETLDYTSSGSFDPTDYPYHRLAVAETIAGGGGGGGVTTTAAGQAAAGAPGAGGGWAYKVLQMSDFGGATATVTVGAAGSAGAAGNNQGGTGGSSFIQTGGGTVLVRSFGGSGGAGMAASAANTVSNGGNGGTGDVGDLIVGGSDGANSLVAGGALVQVPAGGAAARGYGGSQRTVANTSSSVGVAGRLYGGGGTGAHNGPSQGTARAGGAGATGLVRLHIYR